MKPKLQEVLVREEGICNPQGERLSVIPIENPRTVHLDESDLRLFQTQRGWLTEMIASEWPEIIPKNAHGLSVSSLFEKNGIAAVGIQWYESFSSKELVPESEVEECLSERNGISAKLSEIFSHAPSLLETLLADEDHGDSGQKGVSAKVADSQSVNHQVLDYHEGHFYTPHGSIIRRWKLQPSGSPLIILLPKAEVTHHDIWDIFEQYIKTNMGVFFPGADACATERNVNSFAGLDDSLRTVQPYRFGGMVPGKVPKHIYDGYRREIMQYRAEIKTVRKELGKLL